MKQLTQKFSSITILCLMILLTTGELSAQHSYKFRDSLGTYKVVFTPASEQSHFTLSKTKPLLPRTHELRISTSYGGTTWGCDIACDNGIYYYGEALEVPTIMGPSHYYTLTFDYGYWINEWFSVGGSLTYMAGVRNIYNSNSQERLLTLNSADINILPIARFAWYRRGIVQLYSSIGLGMGIELRELYWYGREVISECYFSLDIKPLGVAVGRKWFGFIEAGYGARGIINAGFGVRINNKTR